jgi:hypothetical protein
MNKKLFAELVESMTQMNEIARGELAPSRVFRDGRRLISAEARLLGSSAVPQPGSPVSGAGVRKLGAPISADVRASLRQEAFVAVLRAVGRSAG